MIPPGVWTGDELPCWPLLRSRLWQFKGVIDASGEGCDAPGARDYSSEVSACVPTREIARRLGIAASTVRETLRRLESTGLNWPLPDDMTDGKLETALYTNRGTKHGSRDS
jgi:hypothetical protein